MKKLQSYTIEASLIPSVPGCEQNDMSKHDTLRFSFRGCTVAVGKYIQILDGDYQTHK